MLYVDSIKILENSNLSLVDSLIILEQMGNSINEFHISVSSKMIKTKCINVLMY